MTCTFLNCLSAGLPVDDKKTHHRVLQSESFLSNHPHHRYHHATSRSLLYHATYSSVTSKLRLQSQKFQTYPTSNTPFFFSCLFCFSFFKSSTPGSRGRLPLQHADNLTLSSYPAHPEVAPDLLYRRAGGDCEGDSGCCRPHRDRNRLQGR